MIFSTTDANLIADNLDIILFTMLHKLIGRKSTKKAISEIFGIKAIKVDA